MLGAAGIRFFARDPLVAFRMQWSWLVDPLVAEPLVLLKRYYKTLAEQPHLRVLLGKAWATDKLKNFVSSSRRTQWMRTNGPTTAVISTMKDLNWEVVGPASFKSPQGDTFELRSDVDVLLRQLAIAADTSECNHTAQQHLGGGMQF